MVERARGEVRIGISGWRYAPWRGVFYPRGLAQRRELEFASRMLPTIEINGSFYSLQRPESWAEWHDQTPEGFVFAVKGSRYITHMLKLKDVATPLANFFASGPFRLNAKLGPILWQFPPQLGFDAARFDAFFSLLPRDTGAALALARRHDSRLAGRSFEHCVVVEKRSCERVGDGAADRRLARSHRTHEHNVGRAAFVSHARRRRLAW